MMEETRVEGDTKAWRALREACETDNQGKFIDGRGIGE